ncbi:P3N-PIPO, partial [Passiflora edulis symptomless virus]
GLTKEIVGALASRRNFIDLCKNQPNILVEGLLHPSVIHVLFIAEQKHNALTYCATREEKIVPLISRINALGRHYGLYQSVEEVLQCYMREGMSFYDVLDSCLGGTVSSHFKQELSLKMQRFEESQRMNTLDRIMEKKTRFGQRGGRYARIDANVFKRGAFFLRLLGFKASALCRSVSNQYRFERHYVLRCIIEDMGWQEIKHGHYVVKRLRQPPEDVVDRLVDLEVRW